MNYKTKIKQALHLVGLLSLSLLSACSEKMTVQFETSEQTVAKTASGGSIQVNLNRSSRRSIGLPFIPSTHTSDEVLVPYTVSGTATSGVNHNLADGTLRIPAGASTQTIPFRILDGSFWGTKTLVVQLSAPKGGQVGEKNTHTVYIGDVANSTSFISTWDTRNTSAGSSAANQITLPLEADGTYNFQVDWGDGTQSSISSWNDPKKTHTYSSQGSYTLTIDGTIVGFRFNNGADKMKITNISQFGPLRLGNNGNNFDGASKLTITATDPLNLNGTTTLKRAFAGCGSLTTAPSMANWDTSQVTDMSLMFYVASNFNQDISGWTTTNVTNMGNMFSNARKFNQNIGTWNTENVEIMGSMFEGAEEFNQDIGNWNTSKVIDMSNVFFGATSFNQDVSEWDTSHVFTMSGMFANATTFNQAIGSWDTSQVLDMNYLFKNAQAFNQPVGNWNTSKVTTMAEMFSGAASFNQDIGNWDTSKVTNMSVLFKNAISFNQDIGDWDTSNVTYMSGMFDNATIFNKNISRWNTSKVIEMNSMFRLATAFNQDISSWDTTNVTHMGFMFEQATDFNQPIGNWNISNVLYLIGMFKGATSFNQNISGWNTSKVLDMGQMFYEATAFDQDISNWNVEAVTGTGGYFGGMGDLFFGAGLSTPNYDSLLIGWGSQNVKPNIFFNGGSSKYTPSAAAARNHLIFDRRWTITDGGPG